MNIQLKKKHIAFALTYIPGLRGAEIIKSYSLLTQLNDILSNYDGIGDEVVSIDIKGQTLADAWHVMSQAQEGLIEIIAREMVNGSEGFTGLETQIMTLVNAGDADAIIVAQKMQFLDENYAQQRADQVAANLAYLKEIFS